VAGRAGRGGVRGSSRLSTLCLLGAVVTAAFTGAMSSAGAQGLLEKARSAQVLTVGGTGGAPTSWLERGKPRGIMPDICQRMVEQENLGKLELYVMPFASLLPALLSSRIDFTCDTFYPTPKRRETVDFTDIIFFNPEVIIVKKGNPNKINSLDSLSGRSAGSTEGTVWLDWLNDLNKQGRNITVKAYPSTTDLVADVAAGRLDAGITAGLDMQWALFQNPALGVEVASDYNPRNKSANAVAAAVRKENVDLKEAFNANLKNMKADGSLVKIFEKYGLTPTSLYLAP